MSARKKKHIATEGSQPVRRSMRILAKQQEQQNQTKNRSIGFDLFNLPLELQFQIYDYWLSGKTFYFNVAEFKHKHMSLTRTRFLHGWERCTPSLVTYKLKTAGCSDSSLPPDLSLLSVSRQFYEEIGRYFYASNTFSFDCYSWVILRVISSFVKDTGDAARWIHTIAIRLANTSGDMRQPSDGEFKILQKSLAKLTSLRKIKLRLMGSIPDLTTRMHGFIEDHDTTREDCNYTTDRQQLSFGDVFDRLLKCLLENESGAGLCFEVDRHAIMHDKAEEQMSAIIASIKKDKVPVIG